MEIKKSIAFVCNNIDPSAGGTERVTRYVTEGLEHKGYVCFFIYSHIDDLLLPIDKKIKINQHGSAKDLANELITFTEKKSIGVLIVVNQIYQTPKYQKVYQILKEKTGVKIVGCLHAAPDNWKKVDKPGLVLPKIYLKSRLKRWLCYFYNRNAHKSIGMYQISDKFLLLSERYIPTFCNTFHIDDSQVHKLVAIPNPCPFTDSYQGEMRKNVVLIVSRMAEIQKRIYFALKVWNRIFPNTQKWSLVIVGGGPQLDSYKKYVAKHHLNNVHFAGHSNNVKEYYKTSKIFFMTSVWEGQPMSVIEAMHFGCVPIVVDSFESIHDLVQNNVNGILCNNNDFDDVCKKLSNLLSDEKAIEYYSNTMLYSKNELFDEDCIFQKWDNLLSSLIQNS